MPDEEGPGPENVTPLRAARGKKKFDPNVLEIGHLLREAPELGAGRALVRLDTFSGRILLMRPIPRPGLEPSAKFMPRDVTDDDITHLMEWLIKRGAKKQPGERTLHLAISAEATRNSFSSARALLDSLPAWDGVYRLEKFWSQICGALEAEPGEDELTAFKRIRYLGATAKCFFISIVARILKPGCKVDTMPILEGPQGGLKSTLLRVIALDREELFSDSLAADVTSKDARIHLRGKLIIELAELAQFQGKRVATLKSFLSAQDDKYRPPFGKAEVTYQRQCVFIGTTNHTDYLLDDTGNRRFWPIKCGTIDIAKARALMPQLYAEAIKAYYNGDDWHLSKDIEPIAAEEQADREPQDAWYELADSLVTGRCREARAKNEQFAWVRGVELLRQIIPSAEKHDRATEMRAGALLAKLGGTRKKVPLKMGRNLMGYRFEISDERSERSERSERPSY